MTRNLVLLPLLSALLFTGGCAMFSSSDAPSAHDLSAASAQAETWHDQIRRDPEGNTPTFVPLTDAEKAMTAARAQSGVDANNAALATAEQALSKAQSGWQAIADNDERSDKALAEVASQAHRAQRYAEIARYSAQRDAGLSELQSLQNRVAKQQRSATAADVSDSALAGQRVVPTRLGSLQFDPGTARLTEASRPVIGKLAALLKQHSSLGVAIFGFTNNSEPPAERLSAFVKANKQLAKQNLSHDQQVEAYHQGLSDARARDVAELLVRAGIDAKRIGARGLRAQHPIASNDTASGRRQNERAEAILVPLDRMRGG